MKKFLLLSTAAVALTASASMTTVTSANNEFALGEKVNMEFKATAPTSHMSAMEDASVAGTYVSKSVASSSSYSYNSSGEVTVTANSDGSYSVVGLLPGTTAAVTATYANGVLTIAGGQTVYTSSSYGAAALYESDGENVYNVSLMVDEDGSMSLADGRSIFMILTSGNYQGYRLGASYGEVSVLPVNGTVKFDAYTVSNSSIVAADPAEEEYNSNVTFTYDEEDNVTGGVVTGFDDMCWMSFTVDENNGVQFGTDKVYYYSSSYGHAFAADLTDSGSFYTNAGPTGTIDFEAGKLTMPSWTFVLPNSDSSATSYYYLNSIKKNCVVTFPAQGPSAITDVAVEKVSTARKYIQDGQLVIEKDGVKYNIAGQAIK